MNLLINHLNLDQDWNGKWFPKKPGESDPYLVEDNHNDIEDSFSYANKMKTMGILDPACDDAEVMEF